MFLYTMPMVCEKEDAHVVEDLKYYLFRDTFRKA